MEGFIKRKATVVRPSTSGTPTDLTRLPVLNSLHSLADIPDPKGASNAAGSTKKNKGSRARSSSNPFSALRGISGELKPLSSDNLDEKNEKSPESPSAPSNSSPSPSPKVNPLEDVANLPLYVQVPFLSTEADERKNFDDTSKSPKTHRKGTSSAASLLAAKRKASDRKTRRSVGQSGLLAVDTSASPNGPKHGTRKSFGSGAEFKSAPDQPSPRGSFMRKGEASAQRLITRYVPKAVIDHCTIIHRDKRKLAAESTLLKGACLLIADVSGFTSLNERFAKEGRGGVEKVSFHLNHYFNRLLEIITKYFGDTIKFAGDALLVLFHSTDSSVSVLDVALRASMCALTLQKEVGTYLAGDVELSLHVAVAAGDIFAMHVGGVDGEWEFLLAGPPFANIGSALDASKKGDVVVSKETWDIISEVCKGELVKDTQKGEMKLFEVNKKIPVLVQHLRAGAQKEIDHLVKTYVPRSVLDKLEAGQSEWLAELRRASVIFVNLRGLVLNTPDCGDPAIPHKALRAMQKVLRRNDGYRRQYLVDDKGSTFICVFGIPPFAHSDDAYRAVKTAINLGDTLRALQIQYSIGVATGNVYVGSVGSENLRKEHAVVGDTVNTAARLSGKAPPGKILIDFPTYEGTKTQFSMESKGEIQVKGKQIKLQIFEPSEHADVIDEKKSVQDDTSDLIGRENEVEVFSELLEHMKNSVPDKLTKRNRNKSHPFSTILVIESSTGQGKSHLLQAFKRMTSARGIRNAYFSADSGNSSKPLHGLKSLAKTLIQFRAQKNIAFANKLPSSMKSKAMALSEVLDEEEAEILEESKTVAAGEVKQLEEKKEPLEEKIEKAASGDLKRMVSRRTAFSFAANQQIVLELINAYIEDEPIAMFIENFFNLNFCVTWPKVSHFGC
jgi:class 3 adenylate cyclase